MLIDEIELFHVAMPLKAPWRTAFGEETAIDSILVRLRGEGEEGWGETAPYRLAAIFAGMGFSAFALLRDVMRRH